MTFVRITDLTSAPSLSGSDVTIIVHSGDNYQASITQIGQAILGSGVSISNGKFVVDSSGNTTIDAILHVQGPHSIGFGTTQQDVFKVTQGGVVSATGLNVAGIVGNQGGDGGGSLSCTAINDNTTQHHISVNPNSRQLIGPDGTSVILDWSPVDEFLLVPTDMQIVGEIGQDNATWVIDTDGNFFTTGTISGTVFDGVVTDGSQGLIISGGVRMSGSLHAGFNNFSVDTAGTISTNTGLTMTITGGGPPGGNPATNTMQLYFDGGNTPNLSAIDEFGNTYYYNEGPTTILSDSTLIAVNGSTRQLIANDGSTIIADFHSITGISLPLPLKTYMGQTTTGNGQSIIVAVYDNILNTAVTNQLLYTVPLIASDYAPNAYRVSFHASVRNVALSSSTLGGSTGFQVVYQDTEGSTQTITTGAVPNSSNLTLTANTQTTVYAGSTVVYVGGVSAGTIKFSFGYTSNPNPGMTYNIHVRVEQI